MEAERARSLRDWRMVPVAGAAWLAAILITRVPHHAGALAVALWAAAVAATAVLAWRRRAWIALGAVALAFCAAVSTHVWILQPEREAASGAAQGAVTIAADVTTKARLVKDRLWFDADTITVTSAGETLAVSVPVTVSVAAEAIPPREVLDLGSRVELTGTVKETDAGERSVVIVFADRLEVQRAPPGLLGVASALRDGFATDAVAGLPEPGAGLLPGLAVGDTRGVSAVLDAAMKTSSLTHLTAVSGSNCAIVVGLLFGLAALLRAPRGVRIAAATVALIGFVLLVTPEPSVLRAAVMALIAMLALLLGRTGAGIATLCGAVVALLVWDPWLGTSYGFVLSVLATGALMLLAGPLARGLERWMPRALALGLAIPLSAQLVCGPVIVLLSPRLPLWGVVANLLAAPAAPVATVVGMAACLLQAVPLLGAGLAAIAWVPSAWIAQVAMTFAAAPGAQTPWWGGIAGAALMAVLDAAIAVVIIAPPSLLRRTGAATLAILIGISAGMSALTGVAAPLTVPRDWSVAMCDVGQGDATVIRSQGEVMLVDTGPEPAKLTACLTKLGVTHIDLLVLTHFDLDHVGAVDAVNGMVDTVLHGPFDADGAGWVERAGGQAVDAASGMTGQLGDATWTVLWPDAGTHAFEPGNDLSVAMEVSGGDVPRTLLLGDLSEVPQSMLRGRLTGTFTVLKVAHHGSRDHDPALYEQVRPALALIGVGADNDYGHPNPGVLDELAALGTTVCRTDQDGLILTGLNPDDTLWFWTER
ncbi:MAG: ComEC/Rec2 family competence protein [Microbacterium sp.]